MLTAFSLHSRIARLALGAVLLAFGSGCSMVKKDSDSANAMAAMEPVSYELPATTSGGLFRPGHTGSLVSDKRALRTGDILTVVLNESTQSSKSAGTSFGKSSEVELSVPNFFGSPVGDAETEVSGSRDFSGSSSSSQQNTLRGAIAVTVHQVYPNGTLMVKGRKQLRLNQGDEYIELTGLVRVEDINARNQVSSQNVANAHISYAGRGALSDSNQAGWLTRFFTSPFFPM